MTRRLAACVEAWPECEEGAYHPRCCRFPKSCSCTVYDEALVDDGELEPVQVSHNKRAAGAGNPPHFDGYPATEFRGNIDLPSTPEDEL